MSPRREPGLGRRLGWFAVLWIAGVAAVSGFAYAVRLAIGL